MKFLLPTTRLEISLSIDFPLTFFRAIIGMIFLIVIVFIIVDVTVISKQPYNLVSLSGMVLYVLLFFIFSENPAKVGHLTLNLLIDVIYIIMELKILLMRLKSLLIILIPDAIKLIAL